MSNNALKTPIGAALNDLAKNKADAAIASLGRSWPCSVSKVISSGIVEVSFEVNTAPFTVPKIQVPIAGSEYIRYPIQLKDKGFVVAASVYLGGITGLGSGLPDLTLPGNLSALVFVWLGSTEWSLTDDPNAVVIYGPNGLVARDTDANCVLTVASSGATVTGPTGDLDVAGNLSAGSGITCTFTTPTGQTVTVQNGIITNLY